MRAVTILLLTLFVAMASSLPSLAEEAKPSAEDLARELIRITGSANVSQQMVEAMSAQLKPAFPTVPNELWEEFFAAFDSEEFVELSIPIFLKHYSRDDLAGLVEFYRTPLGQRVVKATPAIMQESFAVGSAWGQQKAAEIIEKLRAKGYEPVGV